jgi:threonine dehydrogenase-like Zn-dependent dehydrogenase
MIAATYTQDGDFAVQDIAIPEPGPGELLLRVAAASICGTDLKIVRNGHRKLRAGQSIVLGHEFVGVVEETGAGVSAYPIGTRVGVVPNAGCGRCDACVAGKANYCAEYTAFGIDRDGAHAQFVRIPAQFVWQGNVIALPETVPDIEAALLEPCSCVVNGLRCAGVGLGDTVVVYGAGPMGLLHIMMSRLAGASQVIAVDPLAERLIRAQSTGCDLAINPQEDNVLERVRDATCGRGADVVITACPVASVQTEAVTLLASFGRLCLFGGLPRGSESVPLDTNLIHYKNLQVSGTTGGSAQDYRIALRLVQSKRIQLASIVSDRFGMHDLAAGYRVALAGAKGKVLFASSAGRGC